MVIAEAVREIQALLASSGIENASWEAREIVSFCLSTPQSALPLLYREEMDQAALQKALQLAGRRAKHYPLQYLLGEWDFYGRRFLVGEGVLIPRQDTELLCETALTFLKGRPNAKVLDLCSGSGCVAITLKKERPDLTVFALEKSPEALFYLQKNLRLHQAEVEALKGDAFFPPESLAGFDCIVCNPPYLTGEDMRRLQPEVAFEPAAALYGEEDGLSFYRELPAIYQKRLLPGGGLLFEIGLGQQDAVAEFLVQAGFVNICFHKDLCDIIRIVCGFAG